MCIRDSLSTDVVQHDMDATGFGYRKGQIPQMPVFFFNADDNLRRLAAEVCKEVNPDIQVFEGKMCIRDRYTGYLPVCFCILEFIILPIICLSFLYWDSAWNRL